MHEFDFIERLLRPLTAGRPGAFELSDDAAVIDTCGDDVVIAKDVLIEGVHFREDDPADAIARKALRVNLSDLAAMGAKPSCYLLGCAWGGAWTSERVEAFVNGLAADQSQYGLWLAGGDTTAHAGAAVFSVTIIGKPPQVGVLTRSGAEVGADVYVSGTIGDAALGLACLMGDTDPGISSADADYLVGRYRLPEPRLALGHAIAGLATAAIDVSDGLLADAAHIAKASCVAIEIDAARVPCSPSAVRWLDTQLDADAARAELAGAGDDYELAFTAPPKAQLELAARASQAGVVISRVGRVISGAGVRLLNASGDAIDVKSSGYTHIIRESQAPDRS